MAKSISHLEVPCLWNDIFIMGVRHEGLEIRSSIKYLHFYWEKAHRAIPYFKSSRPIILYRCSLQSRLVLKMMNIRVFILIKPQIVLHCIKKYIWHFFYVVYWFPCQELIESNAFCILTAIIKGEARNDIFRDKENTLLTI